MYIQSNLFIIHCPLFAHKASNIINIQLESKKGMHSDLVIVNLCFLEMNI